MALSHLLLLISLCCVISPAASIAGSTSVLRGANPVAKPALAPDVRRINPYYHWPIYRQSCCPVGWTRLWNRCFLYFNKPKTWMDAEKMCVKLGGNLVSIHRSSEHKFVKKMVNRLTCSNKSIWIGGFDSMKEGFWLWSDGSRFRSHPWATNLSTDTSEQCLLFRLAGPNWKDKKCTKKYAYVCALTL